jgi:hypothetical protein
VTEHTDLEARLRAYGAELRDSLRTDDLSIRVVAAVRISPRPRRRLSRTVRIAIVAAAIFVLLASASYAGYRVFFVAGPVTVHTEPSPDLAIGTRLRLGAPVHLGDPRLRIPVVTPHVGWIDSAPEVWFDEAASDQVSLTLPPERALPEIGTSGVGLLIQEFDGDGREAIRKYVTTSTRTETVQIGGRPGVFLSGGEHTLFYLDTTGKYVVSPGRVVGNALIFQRGQLTIRLEGQLPRDRMLELANSLR